MRLSRLHDPEGAMCVPADADLPDLPLKLPLPHGQRTFITAADGGRNAAYAVIPQHANGTGILVLPDLRGLFRFYEHLAAALAAEGYHALAIDYFGRTAGVDPRTDEWDTWDDDIDATTPEQITLDLVAGLARLRELGATRTMMLGFCFGGGMGFRNVDKDLGIDGVMSLYGKADDWNQYPAAFDQLAHATCPVLGLFGGADQGIPAGEIAMIEASLGRASVAHEIHVYPGAPHSFFDKGYADHADECRDAWQRVLTFAAPPPTLAQR